MSNVLPGVGAPGNPPIGTPVNISYKAVSSGLVGALGVATLGVAKLAAAAVGSYPAIDPLPEPAAVLEGKALTPACANAGFSAAVSVENGKPLNVNT